MKHRKLTEGKIVIASHNKGKIREINDLIKPFGLEAASSSDYSLSEPEETGTTFIENAELKARYTAEKCGLPALSDDSGLVVPKLDGAPGIYSARWAGREKDFNAAMQKIKVMLEQKYGTSKGHDAHFICALSICWPDNYIESFEGKVFGKLVFPPRGTKGFGYDPIFVAQGYSITFGEMEPEEKHTISHRAEAFKQFVNACLKK